MTISGVPTLPLQFNGNGATDTFSISFPFAKQSHVIVTHVAGNGTQTVMTQDAEGDFGYVIEETDTGSGDYQVVCNTAPATGSQLHINRTTPLTQETDFQQGRQYNPQRVEDALDKLTMMAQESDIASGSAASAATDAAAAASSAEAAHESATAAAVSAATIEDRVYVPDSSEADQGVASAGGTSTIKDFVDLLGVKNGTIKLTHDLSNASTVYTLTTDETIPANIKFVMEHGARIDGAGTLTVQGEFEASEDYDAGTATIAVASTKGKVLGKATLSGTTTNSGTISGGTVNPDTLQIGGVAQAKSGNFVNDADGYPSMSTESLNIALSMGVTPEVLKSVGPTGSGADVIWTALDNVPAAADWIDIRISTQVLRDAGEFAPFTYYVCARRGGGTAAQQTPSKVSWVTGTGGTGAEGYAANTTQARIPVNAVQFEMQVVKTGTTGSEACYAYLVGYGYNP